MGYDATVSTDFHASIFNSKMPVDTIYPNLLVLRISFKVPSKLQADANMAQLGGTLEQFHSPVGSTLSTHATATVKI